MIENVPEPGGIAPSVDLELSPALISALNAHGPEGMRAAGLLQDARSLLADTGRWKRPYEAAVTLCRGVLDSLLKLAGEDFPGVKGAEGRALNRIEAFLAARQESQTVGESSGLDLAIAELEKAYRELESQRADKGGFRIEQVGFLVEKQTRRSAGPAERAAAKMSWSALYSRTSSVLHGSEAAPEEAVAIFRDVVAAVTQVFLALPERAGHLRELAELPSPSQKDANEISMLTDPRSGAYFFRAATSRQWLNLLPTVRLLPETGQWPARPYLERLSRSDPGVVTKWLAEQLPAICALGTAAVRYVIDLARIIGIAAARLLLDLLKTELAPTTLPYILYWAMNIPVSDRNRQWITVVESILTSRDFTRAEGWGAGQLLERLLETAYPSGPDRPASDLAKTVRFALANLIVVHMDTGADSDPTWFAGLAVENDLRKVDLGQPAMSFIVPLARALLTMALTDANAGDRPTVRLDALRKKAPGAAETDRIAAVHLLESYASDHDAEPTRAMDWWDEALDVARRAVALPGPRADVADFIALLDQECSIDRRHVLNVALSEGLGMPPDAAALAECLAQVAARRGIAEPWSAVWSLSPVLPNEVLKPWQPLLDGLRTIAGSSPTERPLPQWSVSSEGVDSVELPYSRLLEIVSEAGAAAAAELIATTPATGHPNPEHAYVSVIHRLVKADPAVWAADPAAIVGALAEPGSQDAYLAALSQTLAEDPSLVGLSVIRACAELVEQFLSALPVTEAAWNSIYASICSLLQIAWSQGVDLEPQQDERIARWLDDSVAMWTMAYISSGDPLNKAFTQPGGNALRALICWGTRRAPPADVPDLLIGRLDALLAQDPPDDRALAVIGYCLTPLYHHAPGWVANHADALLNLDASWRPARAWLCHTPIIDPALLGMLPRHQYQDWLRSPGATVDHAALALLSNPTVLGDLESFFLTLAAGAGGPQIVSKLLSRIGWNLSRVNPGDSPVDFTSAGNALLVWRSALSANLPKECLVGAGAFAYANLLDDQCWLELTADTLRQTSELEASPKTASRAARNAVSPIAAFIMTRLVGNTAAAFWDVQMIQDEAIRLLLGSRLFPSIERDALKTALVEAGVVEAAFVDEEH